MNGCSISIGSLPEVEVTRAASASSWPAVMRLEGIPTLGGGRGAVGLEAVEAAVVVDMGSIVSGVTPSFLSGPLSRARTCPHVNPSRTPLTTRVTAGCPRARARALPRPRPELAALLVLAAVLNLWALDQNGWANEYYSAAVRSMASSWHNFLYGSFDASGVMTVDKPPLALWVQALSVKAFGFNSLSILVPQALMGMGSVALVYDLTRRRFGRVAGGVAGLVLATTPITVAISRHNNPDALLCCARWPRCGSWCARLEDGRTKWLVWAGVCVGPRLRGEDGGGADGGAGHRRGVAVGRAARGRGGAGRSSRAAPRCRPWAARPLLVALTPAADRPWVSGTSDNSILSLIFGYNGLGRLSGQAGGPQASAAPARSAVIRAPALAQREPRRTGRLAARVRARRGHRHPVRHPAAALRRAHRLADRRRRRVPRDRRRVQLRPGHLPPLLRVASWPFTAALVGASVAFLAGAGLAARIAAPLAVAAGVPPSWRC